MRVLVAVGWYFPESAGGTEVYVRGLVAGLRASGVDVAIAVPSGSSSPPADHVYEGVPVFRFAAPYGADPETDLEAPEPREWVELLDRFRPDVVDLHSITPALGIAHIKAARARGVRTVFTVHVPGLVCARGTLMKFGHIPCDGDLARQPCVVCRLEDRGVPPVVGRLLAHVPEAVGEWAKAAALPSWLASPLSVTRAQQHHRAVLEALAAHTDRFVVVSRWLVDALMRNGIPATKIELCRQGVERPATEFAQRSGWETGPLRAGFIGRFDRVKGLHILIDAVKTIPREFPVQLNVWGIARTADARANRSSMLERGASDPRILFHPESSDSASMFRQIDVLVVPSIWFETGPLVVLEAQAQGIPVIGSNLGGIAERVDDGKDGLLVPPGDVRALANVLMELARDPVRLASLRHAGSVRTMADAAAETLNRYEHLIAAA